MSLDKNNKLQMTALTILRVLVGWHFLYEGIAKLMKDGWSAAGFLGQAKGAFAPIFHWIADTPAVLDIVNQMNIWGLIAIGLGLIMGAFTSIASIAGMMLILLYYVCNPPFTGLFYSLPSEGNYLIVNKNLVEFGALFVLAVTSSGKFLGLDLIISKLLKRK